MKRSIVYLALIISATTFAQVGIGTVTPDASSVFDISASDKGMLVPRVSLNDVTNTMIDGTNTAATGLLIWNTNASVTGGSGVGFYYFNGTSWERLVTTASVGDDIDWYEEGGTSAPNDIADDKYTFGNLAIGKNTADYRLEVREATTTATRALSVSSNYNDSGVLSSIFNEANFDGSNSGRGIYNLVSGTGGGSVSGTYNNIQNGGNGVHFGVNNLLAGNGTGIHYGVRNSLDGTGDGDQYGIHSIISNSGSGNHYGVYNRIETGTGTNFGTYNFIGGTGTILGTFNEIFANSNPQSTGVLNDMRGDSDTKTAISNDFSNGAAQNEYGLENLFTNNSSSAGNSYGVYSNFNNNSSAVQYGTYNNFLTSTALAYGLYNNGSVENNSFYGVNNDLNLSGTGTIYGTHTDIVGGGNGDSYGVRNLLNTLGSGMETAVRNEITGSGTGEDIGIWNTLSGSSANFQTGVLNEFPNSGNNLHLGVSNVLSGDGGGEHIGLRNSFSGTGSGIHRGVHNVMNSSGDGMHYGISNNLIGSGSGEHYATYNVVNGGDGDAYGTFSSITGAGTTASYYGTRNQMAASNNPLIIGTLNEFSGIANDKKGVENDFSTGNAQRQYGVENHFTSSVASNRVNYGMYSTFNNASATTQYGAFNLFNTNSSIGYGMYNQMNGGEGEFYGMYNVLTSSGAGDKIGSYSVMAGTSNGDFYGNRVNNQNSGNGRHYGTDNNLTGIGSGNKYGSHNIIDPLAGGTHYGLYSEVLKSGSYAGYFLGTVSIGTTTTNNYLLPSNRGTVNQVLQTDGSGNVSWVDPSSLDDSDWIDVGANIERQAGDVYIGDSSGTDNDMYISDRIFDWDNTSYYLDPGAESFMDEISFDDGTPADVSIRFDEQNTGFYSPSSNVISLAVNGTSKLNWRSNANGVFRTEIVSNSDNILIGDQAGVSLDTGSDNVAIGTSSLQSNSTGTGNTAIGERTLANATGGYNTALGAVALGSITGGEDNVGIGTSALFSETTGSFNSGLGRSAGFNVNGGSNNVFVGYRSGSASSLRSISGSVFIGYQAGFGVTASNRLYVENSASTSPLIYGEFDNDFLRVNGDFEVVLGRGEFNFTNEATGTAGSGVVEIENSLRLDGDEIITNTGTTLNLQAGNDGDINMDSGTVLVDASTNRMGIGTTTPSTSLHVNHPTGTTNGLSISNASDADRWHLYTFSTNNLHLYFNNANRGSFDDVSGVYTPVSDRSLKRNISDLFGTLDKVKRLRPVDYNFIDQRDSKKYVGFIAQEVEQVYPQLVQKSEQNGNEYTPYRLDYSGFGPIAIKAIQEQQQIIENQQDEIDLLKDQLQQQQQAINEMKGLINSVVEKR